MSINQYGFFRFFREVFLKNNKHTIKYGFAKGLKRVGGISFLPLKRKLTKEKQYLSSLVFKSKVVYDVGAAEGIHTLFFAREVEGRGGKVVAFEPNPRSYHFLKRNIEVNGFKHVLLSNFAIGSKDDTMDLEVPKYFRGHGSLLHKGLNKKILTKVKVKSIDNLLKQNKYPTPDFIKIDIEGFELPALEGMKFLLQNKKPQLFIEVHNFVPNNMNNIIEFLEYYNYNIYHVERDLDQKGIKNEKIIYGHIFCK